MASCELPFWKDPAILIRDFTLSYEADCDVSKWNFTGRLFIIALLLGLIGMPFAKMSGFIIAIAFASIISLIIISTGTCTRKKQVTFELPAVIHENFADMKTPDRFIRSMNRSAHEALPLADRIVPKPAKKEGFQNVGPASGTIVSDIYGVEAELPYNDAAPYNGPALPDSLLPTAKNLFMNVLLDEYKYNPTRPAAAPVSDPLVKQTLDDYFRVQWFSDPTDVFGKNQGQRQFVTQPSTSIPNDRESYQNWLYKIPGKTCKEGGRDACYPATSGSPVTWLNQQY
jgi:hypothetical protein